MHTWHSCALGMCETLFQLEHPCGDNVGGRDGTICIGWSSVHDRQVQSDAHDTPQLVEQQVVDRDERRSVDFASNSVAVVTHWTRIREDPGSIPGPAILISVFPNHSRRMLGWVPDKGNGRFLPNPSTIPFPYATCTGHCLKRLAKCFVLAPLHRVAPPGVTAGRPARARALITSQHKQRRRKHTPYLQPRVNPQASKAPSRMFVHFSVSYTTVLRRVSSRRSFHAATGKTTRRRDQGNTLTDLIQPMVFPACLIAGNEPWTTPETTLKDVKTARTRTMPARSHERMQFCISHDPIVGRAPRRAATQRSEKLPPVGRCRGRQAEIHVHLYCKRGLGPSACPEIASVYMLLHPKTITLHPHPPEKKLWGIDATVAERLARSPHTKANRVQSPAGSPDFRKWESCQTMPLVGRSSRGSLSYSGAAPYSLQPPSSALETSVLRAAQISSLSLRSHVPQISSDDPRVEVGELYTCTRIEEFQVDAVTQLLLLCKPYPDIYGDSSPFLLQPFHELSNEFWPRLTSPHPAI
ncbi:hypothetical protein PR048_032322 [Dryococelus australis]|uniref:Uncharacterized protein n=1 Tax=Dryococelus australis TaxID=614101 RepID=A0ABQ9G1Y0_9NEOP|nr:hypothetical protein PR048_032322 [Dryococelus australis]